MKLLIVLGAFLFAISTIAGGPNPSSGQVGTGHWKAHNEQGDLAPWIESDAGFPQSHVTMESTSSATIEWYKFGFGLDHNTRYVATAILSYRITTDEPTGYSFVARVSNGVFKPYNSPSVSINSIALAPTNGEWESSMFDLGVFRGSDLNATQTKMLFNVAPLMDLGFKIEVNVEIVATPVE